MNNCVYLFIFFMLYYIFFTNKELYSQKNKKYMVKK